MRRTVCALAVTTALAMVLATPVAAQSRDDRDSIEWPAERAAFPTIQSAIEHLRDDGKLLLGDGDFPISMSERLIVRNKRITIEGKGCGEPLPRGKRKTDRATHLVGERPDRVVPFPEVVPLLTITADDPGAIAGGVIRGVKLSGFDAGIGVVAGDGGDAGRSVVTIEDVCIVDGGRGIASSAPSAKLVAQNVLIRNVLGTGISISPSVVSGLASAIFMSFGVTVLNTGQACVVVKNGLYTAFQNHLVNCGFNGGLPGAGGGLLAQNSGVNFLESSVNAPNGPGIAANGGTTLIEAGSLIFLARGMGILLFEPLYALIKDTHVRLTQPFPPGHPKAGNFGDAVLVAGAGSVWIGNTLLEDTARAGIANWGSFVDVGDTKIQCSAFHLEGEPFPPGQNFVYNDRGGNTCGCPDATGVCEAVSAGLAPPDPVVASE